MMPDEYQEVETLFSMQQKAKEKIRLEGFKKAKLKALKNKRNRKKKK